MSHMRQSTAMGGNIKEKSSLIKYELRLTVRYILRILSLLVYKETGKVRSICKNRIGILKFKQGSSANFLRIKKLQQNLLNSSYLN